MSNENKVVIFSDNMKEYYIGEVLSSDNNIWRLKNVAQIFPIGNNLFVPIGFAFPEQNGLKIIPLAEFYDGDIFIEQPRMWVYASKRIIGKYKDFVKDMTAKKAGITLARSMEDIKKVGKQISIT